MAVFVIMSDRVPTDLRAAVERHYPAKFFHWGDRVSFVEASGTAQSISRTLGIKTNDGDVVTGTIGDAFVSQLAPSYWGWTDKDLWTWLASAHEGDGA